MKLQTIPIAKCVASATNPRGKKISGAEFDELVASIREQGILMPILVRPQNGGFEVVAGSRRLRAAQQLELKEIPAHVVEMNDIEAREAQIVENLQRADVHPLEEGAAYRDLIEQSGYDVAAVAAKVGKSESYVRDRLVLTNLTKKAQQAFRDALITAGHAALVARLDEKQQKDALEFLDVDNDTQWREVATTAELRRWIQERVYAASMSNPPWQGDDEMKAALGGCEECKGKGGDLFGKQAAEACTNPKCYANRLAAFIDIKLKAEPSMVKLSGDYTGSEDIPGSGHYREINSKKDACDHEEKGIVVEGRGVGRIVRFCRAPECKKHWGDRSPQGHYKPTEKEKEARKKVRQAEVKKREKDAADVEAALSKVKWPLNEKQLAVLFDRALDNASHDVLQGTCKRRTWEAPKHKDWHGRDYRGEVKRQAAAMEPRETLALVFELLLSGYSPHYNGGRAGTLKNL